MNEDLPINQDAAELERLDQPDDLYADVIHDFDEEDWDTGFDDEELNPRMDLLDQSFNAQQSVEEWDILSVGRRPKDYMTGDCLFASLFRDRRVPWFRRYIKRPSPWMEVLVAHIEDKADRQRALRYVVLHYLHKLHLVRLMDFYARTQDAVWEDDAWVPGTLQRVWNCTPYTVEVARADGDDLPLRACNMPRLCPWCHARKVVKLYEALQTGPLNRPNLVCLLLGKADPFAERMGGIDGSYNHADWYMYIHGGEVRGHWGRYFGRSRDRLRRTTKILGESLSVAAMGLGFHSGIWTCQLGSAQLESGQRTFLYDVSLIAEIDQTTINRMPGNNGEEAFRGGFEDVSLVEGSASLQVLWLPLPPNSPNGLRVALAGSSVRYAVTKLGLKPNWFGTDEGRFTGIQGALSWQPTILFDDQLWFTYAEAVKNQPLYHAFGTWKKSLSGGMKEQTMSESRKFQVAQVKRITVQREQATRRRQQKGNQARETEAQDRRERVLPLARALWARVITETSSARGRPPRRKRLEELLIEQNVRLSRRDLVWLMQQLGSSAD